MRLFTAIGIYEPLKDGIEAMRRGLPGARWTPREQLHLSLRFIGEVSQGVFLEIRDALQGLRQPTFPLVLTGVGTFSGPGRSRVLWIGAEHSEPLLHLRSALDRILSSLGLRLERSKFHPHVTIARAKKTSPDRLHSYLEEYGDFHSEPFLVEEFMLFSSKLRPEGALHSLEEVYPLVKTDN